MERTAMFNTVVKEWTGPQTVAQQGPQTEAQQGPSKTPSPNDLPPGPPRGYCVLSGSDGRVSDWSGLPSRGATPAPGAEEVAEAVRRASASLHPSRQNSPLGSVLVPPRGATPGAEEVAEALRRASASLHPSGQNSPQDGMLMLPSGQNSPLAAKLTLPPADADADRVVRVWDTRARGGPFLCATVMIPVTQGS